MAPKTKHTAAKLTGLKTPATSDAESIPIEKNVGQVNLVPPSPVAKTIVAAKGPKVVAKAQLKESPAGGNSEAKTAPHHFTRKVQVRVQKKASKKPGHELVFVEGLKAGITICYVEHKSFDNYPGATSALEQKLADEEGYGDVVHVTCVAHFASTKNPNDMLEIQQRDKTGTLTDKFRKWTVFVYVSNNPEGITAAARAKWGTGMGVVCTDLWPHGGDRPFKFWKDVTPIEGERRCIGDVVCTVEAVDIMRTCYAGAEIADLLADDETMELFFPKDRIQSVRDFYSVQSQEETFVKGSVDHLHSLLGDDFTLE